MNSQRIKEIQKETAYPNSVSVQQALLQVWNECEQQNKNLYSEEEVKEIVYHMVGALAQANNMTFNGAILDEIFEQFKKK